MSLQPPFLCKFRPFSPISRFSYCSNVTDFPVPAAFDVLLHI
uniref:Uncharacterized protein n=1 Tax=Lotus japonicus TaxID=34305 RepID=I3SBG0_LOTJA|nr:unknown [Lotus japonicus]